MQVYNFREGTGEFVSEGVADESPREPGVFIVPANATVLKPKPSRSGYVVVFREGRWGYVRSNAVGSEPTEEPGVTEADYADAVQSVLDTKAQERRYDSIASAVTYRGDPNPAFHAEATALFNWRSAVWTKAYEEFAKVRAGEREAPTVQGFIEELPAFVWP